jgi:WD40 repeat protein
MKLRILFAVTFLLHAACFGAAAPPVLPAAAPRAMMSFSKVLPAHKGPIKALAWNPIVPILASGGYDGQIRLWDQESRLIKTIERPPACIISSLAWNPEGTILASAEIAGENGTICLWDASGSLIRRFSLPSSQINSLSWNHNGTTLASASHNGTFWLWDASENLVTRVIDGNRISIRSITWTHDETGYSLFTCRKNGLICKWTPDKMLITSFIICDPEILRFSGINPLHSFAWSPDGKILAASGDKNGTIRFWKQDGRFMNVVENDGYDEASVCRPNFKMPSRDKHVNSLAWSPDGTMLAAARADRGLLLWTTKDGKIIERRKLSVSCTSSTIIGPRDLACSIQIHEEYSGGALCLSWSPDGKILATGDSHGKIHIFSFR